jgi:hypothetical protein
MRGGLAVLIAAELLTLLPMNDPGVSEATKRCTVADLGGKRRAAVSSTYPGMFSLISFQTICPPAHSASIREPDVNELPYFKYVISLHADHPSRSRFFVGMTFHVRNARLLCHDEIRRQSKGESTKIR